MLRDYQLECLNSIKALSESGERRQLVVLPTGTGKTHVFAHLRKHMNLTGRVLVLAHREELLDQARNKLIVCNPLTTVEIEQAERRASQGADFVVASVPTLGRENSKRLENLNPGEFSAIILDEAHHCFHEDTKISTARGEITILQVIIGDLVKCWLLYGRFEYRRVLNKFIYPSPRQLARVKTISGRSCVCTLNHKVWTDYGYATIQEILDISKVWQNRARQKEQSGCLSKKTSAQSHSFVSPAETSGYEEGDVFEIQEVALLQINKRGCASWDSIRTIEIVNGEGYVYDIEVEEAHNYFANGLLSSNSSAQTYVNILNHFGVLNGNPHNILLTGWTATPNRADNIGLEGIFGVIAYQKTLAEMIETKWLVPIRGYKVKTDTDLSGVHTRQGDFVSSELSKEVNTVYRNRLAVTSYLEKTTDRKAIAFAVDVKHVYDLNDTFKSYGVASEALVGETPPEERQRTVVAFRRGDIKVLVNCNVATEGFDVPDASAIILARPTQSGLWYCLDLSTEILTPDGWKKYCEIEKGGPIYGFDTKTNMIVETIISDKIVRPLSNKEHFYSVKTNSVDLRVTNKHRVLYDNKRHKGWKIKTAEDVAKLKDMFRIPCAGFKASKGLNLSDAEIRFIGWFLTDGCRGKKGQVFISQNENSPHLKDLEQCLTGCNFRVRVYIHNSKTQFKRNGKQLDFCITWGIPRSKKERHLKGCGYLEKYLDKNLSKHLWSLDDRQFGILLEAIHWGDGSKQLGQYWTRRSYHITTGNKIFADNLQHLALLHGYRCNITYYHNSYNGNINYMLHIKKQPYRVIGGRNNSDRGHLSAEEYKPEPVWCVSNPLGTIIVRRNGKVSIVGNCQAIGRGTRLHPGKEDLVVIDLVDASSRHRLIALPSLFGLKPTFDLAGKDALQTAKDIEQLQVKFPRKKFDRAESLEDINAIYEQVDLLEMAEFAEEAMQYSPLAWFGAGEGKYHLPLPDRLIVKILEGALGKCAVWVADEAGNMVWTQEAPGLDIAFQVADRHVREVYPKSLAVVKREAGWRKGPPTPAQLGVLARLKIEHDPGKITKGEASNLISAFFANKEVIKS